MTIIHVLASLLGALMTIVALWPDGWLLALICAPLGGSALTLAVAVTFAFFRTGRQTGTPATTVVVDA